MDTDYAYDATEGERAEVDAWIAATDCAGLVGITIAEHYVSAWGSKDHFEGVSGTTVRDRDLSAELKDALAVLRTVLPGPKTRSRFIKWWLGIR